MLSTDKTVTPKTSQIMASAIQAIIWINAAILLIGPSGTNFSEILIEIHLFLFKKMHFKMSYGKWQPFCLCLNVLTYWHLVTPYGTIKLGSTLCQVMTCHLFSAKPLPEPMLELLSIEALGTNFNKNVNKRRIIAMKQMHLKMSSARWLPFWKDLDVLRLFSLM